MRTGKAAVVTTAGMGVASALTYQFYFGGNPVKGALVGSQLGLALNFAYAQGGGGAKSWRNLATLLYESAVMGMVKTVAKAIVIAARGDLNEWPWNKRWQDFYEALTAYAWSNQFGQYMTQQGYENELVHDMALVTFSLMTNALNELAAVAGGKDWVAGIKDALDRTFVGFANSRFLAQIVPAPLVKDFIASLMAEEAKAVVDLAEAIVGIFEDIQI